MAITVKIHTRVAGRTSLYASRDVDTLPVSIGRDQACTILLADPHKHISRFHVEIEEVDGVYWMSVVSKVNPVIVKDRRYGPGTRLTLASGDSFEIGEYEIQVLLPERTETEAAPRPAPPSAASPRDPRSTTMTVVEDEDTAEKLFNEATFFGAETAPPSAPREEMIPAPDAPEETFVPGRPGGAPQPTAAAAAPKELSAAEIERALMAGMRAAILGALRRFDPTALERALGKSAKGFSLASRKSKLWDLFVEQQAKLAQEGQDDLNKAFGGDFMDAYQTELRRLKGGK